MNLNYKTPYVYTVLAHKQTLALILLPFLFKRVTKQTIRSENKTAWVPEKTDVSKTFVFHIKVYFSSILINGLTNEFGYEPT